MAQIGEGSPGIGEEHRPESRNNGPERRGFERVILGIGQDEARHRASYRGASPGDCDHRRGNVDAGARDGSPQSAGHRQRRTPCAAADVEDRATANRHRVHKQALEGLEHAIQQFLRLDPGTAGHSIPEFRLFIAAVLRKLHGALPM
ncbi:hypothetical protein J2X06_000396 [Lysobacter niastensis]|uniref:Uncharacterized protein n=1 Tax=Lysobacter niastensis TaxID=380629 RepID=A0ABU1W6J6_9GAMM|nr:hypothetical protein [Lysobacter niastensis]